jgi:hypothetical protein
MRCPMSEKLVVQQVADLKTIRVTCKNNHCGGVIEVPVKWLDKTISGPNGKGLSCPVCSAVFVDKSYSNELLVKLCQTIDALRDKSEFEVSFVFPNQ